MTRDPVLYTWYVRFWKEKNGYYPTGFYLFGQPSSSIDYDVILYCLKLFKDNLS